MGAREEEDGKARKVAREKGCSHFGPLLISSCFWGGTEVRQRAKRGGINALALVQDLPKQVER